VPLVPYGIEPVPDGRMVLKVVAPLGVMVTTGTIVLMVVETHEVDEVALVGNGSKPPLGTRVGTGPIGARTVALLVVLGTALGTQSGSVNVPVFPESP